MSINQVAKISGNRLVPSKEGDEINPNIIDLSEDDGNMIEKRTNGLYVGSLESDYDRVKKLANYTGDINEWSLGLLGAFNIQDVYVGTEKKQGLRVWIGETTTTDSNVVVYPTTTGDANGEALFSDIVFAIGIIWHPDGSTINSTHLLGGNKISADFKSISFYNVKGGISIVGGAGLQSGDSGKKVKVIAIGVPT